MSPLPIFYAPGATESITASPRSSCLLNSRPDWTPDTRARVVPARMPKGRRPAKLLPPVSVEEAVGNVVKSLRMRAAGHARRVLQWEELARAMGKGKGAARIAFLRNLNPNLRRGPFTAEEVMLVACLHLKLCRSCESPISEIGIALGTTDAYGLPIDFRSPFDISDLLRKTAEKDCPPRSAAQSLFFFNYARRLPAVMASEGFAGDRAWDLLAWNFRKAVQTVTPHSSKELELLLRALHQTGQLAKFGFRSNTLPTEMRRAVQQLRHFCARRNDPAGLLWGRTRPRTPTQTVEVAPIADAAVHITAGPRSAAAAGETGASNGNASPDKLLALLRAAGMANNVVALGSPAGTGGRPQLWARAEGPWEQHQPSRKSERNVRRRIVDVAAGSNYLLVNR
ncbi:hypothetical protein WJX75_004504 [Coccomyxa subellipsoidea]|uniref:Uncharacterized protein n=1 Tax=Coccomyxa subellipsoidea TaxID=248742 RepID=A0ABR2Z4T3_9CHLO